MMRKNAVSLVVVCATALLTVACLCSSPSPRDTKQQQQQPMTGKSPAVPAASTPTKPKAAVSDIPTSEALETLLSFVPNKTTSLMVFNQKKSMLAKLEVILQPLAMVLPFEAFTLASGLRPLQMGAMDVSAKSTEHLNPMAVVTLPSGAAQTLYLLDQAGAAEQLEKETEKLSGLPFERIDVGWSRLLLSEKVFALTSADDASKVAEAVAQKAAGKPAALALPIGNVDANTMVVRIRGIQEGARLPSVAVDLDETPDGGMTLTWFATANKGALATVKLQIDAILNKPDSPVKKIWSAPLTEEDGMLKQTLTIDKETLMSLAMQRPTL